MAASIQGQLRSLSNRFPSCYRLVRCLWLDSSRKFSHSRGYQRSYVIRALWLSRNRRIQICFSQTYRLDRHSDHTLRGLPLLDGLQYHNYMLTCRSMSTTYARTASPTVASTFWVTARNGKPMRRSCSSAVFSGYFLPFS